MITVKTSKSASSSKVSQLLQVSVSLSKFWLNIVIVSLIVGIYQAMHINVYCFNILTICLEIEVEDTEREKEWSPLSAHFQSFF